MKIDESKILKNINEFLLQSDPLNQAIQYNWKLRDLRIGEGERVQWLLYKLPLTMDVSFATKDDVFSFLSNIEQRVHFSPDAWFDANLVYHLKSFNYDILNYTRSQDVQVELIAYYYNAKKGFF
jgi:hypothetical protein